MPRTSQSSHSRKEDASLQNTPKFSRHVFRPLLSDEERRDGALTYLTSSRTEWELAGPGWRSQAGGSCRIATFTTVVKRDLTVHAPQLETVADPPIGYELNPLVAFLPNPFLRFAIEVEQRDRTEQGASTPLYHAAK
jgi:hypothetical protein